MKRNFDIFYKMKRAIYLIIFIGILFACNQTRENQRNSADDNAICIACEISDILADLIRRVTADETKTNFDGESRVVSLTFYQIDNRDFFIFSTASTYVYEEIEIFCIFENKLLIYSGINEKVAGKYINFKPRDVADIPKIFRPSLGGGYHPKHRERYFKLQGTEIVEFQPDREHMWELFNLLVDAGNILLPPPLPCGAVATRENVFNRIMTSLNNLDTYEEE